MFRVIHPNRWFFWTIAMIIAAGLGLLFYIQRSANEFNRYSEDLSQQLATWRVFRSEPLGIAVRYPAFWQIEIDPSDAKTVMLESSQNFSENISISRIKPNLEPVIRSALKIDSESDITIDGVKARWIKGQERKDLATSNVILLKKGGDLYYIAGSANQFKKIVTGIKFIK